MIEIVGRSLLAFVMLAAPVNAAAAEWSSVATIAEDASTPLIFPTVAMDSSGNALVAWLGPESMVHVAERAAGQTTWQQRGAVSQAGASDVVAALAADGGALVAWARAGNVEFAYRPAGGSFAAPIPISGAGPSAAHVQTAFDPQGNAFFTFNYVPTTDHVLGWSVRTTTGVVGAVQDFDPTVSADSAARLGFGASGEGIAAWDGVDFGFGYHLGALIRPAGAAFGLGIAIQSDMNPLTTPDLAVGTDGRAVIADIEAGEIHLLLRPAGGNVGTFVSGDIPVFTFGVPETPQVGLLSDGTALIAWKRSMALEWKTYSTGLVLGQTMGVLGAAPEIDLDLAVDAKDNGVLIWIQNNLVHASARPPGGTFDAARQIATTPIASHPRLARDGQGTTLVVWDAQHAGTSGTTYAIEAAAYGEPPEPPPPPPPCGTIRCVISAAIQGANCGDEHLSKALTKKLDGAIAKSEAAANAPAKKARRMSKAAKALFRRAGQLAKRAGRGRKPELSAECVTDLRSAVTTAIGLLT